MQIIEPKDVKYDFVKDITKSVAIIPAEIAEDLIHAYKQSLIPVSNKDYVSNFIATLTEMKNQTVNSEILNETIEVTKAFLVKTEFIKNIRNAPIVFFKTENSRP